MTRGQTRDEALRVGRERLAEAETPGRDARDLLLHVLGIEAATLIATGSATLTDEEAKRYEAVLARRAAYEPVSKIVGRRAFHGLEFQVTADVLDPRPDSETLVDAALELAPDARTVLDLGTGSGCLLLSILHRLPRASGLGVDVSEAALAVARRNARRLDLNERTRFLRSDWLEKVDGTFDLVVCNPPYIGECERETLSDDVRLWDPQIALFADEDGLAAYRRIAPELGRALSETGTAFFEIGSGQEEAVFRLFAACGFGDITFRRDIAGIRRCMIVRRHGPQK